MLDYLLDGEESERLKFRQISLNDYSEWLKFFKNPDTSKHWVADDNTPEVECKQWYERQFERYVQGTGGMNALIEKESNKFVGHCGLLKQVVDGISELEIAYSLLPIFWNKAYASEAAIKCKNYAFENNLTNSLISIISLTNRASEKVALKVGMTLDKTTTYRSNDVNIFRINK
jgi:RimJ/RimL family protein N-acetyltransferase